MPIQNPHALKVNSTKNAAIFFQDTYFIYVHGHWGEGMQSLVSIEDALYNSAMDLEQWPIALEKIANMTNSSGAVLIHNSESGVFWISSDSLRTVLDAEISESWVARRVAQKMKKQTTGVVLFPRYHADSELYDNLEQEKNSFFHETLQPDGLGRFASATFAHPHGGSITLIVERSFQNGPFSNEDLDALSALRPHIVRSIIIAVRVSSEKVQTLVEFLDRLGLAAFAIKSDGKIGASNETYKDEKSRWCNRNRINLSAMEIRTETITNEKIYLSNYNTGIISVPLLSLSGTERAILNIMPVERTIFSNIAFMGVVSKSGKKSETFEALLQIMFNLTPREASVAAKLTEGRTAHEIATEDGKSVVTVRNQINSILQKTGCHRLSDLSLMLARLIPGSL